MKNKIKNNNVTNNNMEVKNMQQNNENVNAAPAAENDQVQNNVPTPPVEGQAQASEEKPKKGLLKKILIILGAILALITGGFFAGRISGKKSNEDYDESDDVQTTEF